MKQRGFSILSMIITVMVVASLAVSVFKYYQYISESNKAAELVMQMRNIKAAALQYRSLNEHPAYIFKKLNSQEVAPRNWEPRPTSHRWVTPKWGTVFIGGLGAGGYGASAPPGIGNLDGFLFTISKVEKEICLKVVQGLEGDFDFVALNNSNRKILKNYNLPFSHIDAATECGRNGDNVWLGLMVYQ